MFLAFFLKEGIITDGKLLDGINFVMMIFLSATTILTIYSGCSYLIRNRHVFKEEKAVEKKETTDDKKAEEKPITKAKNK